MGWPKSTMTSLAPLWTKSQVRARTTQMTVTVGWGTRMLCSFNCLSEKLWKLGKLQQSEGEATAVACNHKCMATDDWDILNVLELLACLTRSRWTLFDFHLLAIYTQAISAVAYIWGEGRGPGEGGGKRHCQMDLNVERLYKQSLQQNNVP